VLQAIGHVNSAGSRGFYRREVCFRLSSKAKCANLAIAIAKKEEKVADSRLPQI
jgi:hypothetical protein